MKKIIMVGGGGHVFSLLQIQSDLSNFLGYVDIVPNTFLPLKYLGNDDFALCTYSPDDFLIHCGVVYTESANLKLRKSILNKFVKYDKLSTIASSALITCSSKILHGTAIFERCVINGAFIGENSIINTGAIVEHNSKICNNVFVGTGAVICGDVQIYDDVFIGAGSVIRDGIAICSDSIIGAGSVVVKDIKEAGVYVGNPAKKIKMR